jgi:hypothetical protein
MRILGANAEITVPLNETKTAINAISSFFSSIGVPAVRVYVENGEFTSEEMPIEGLQRTIADLLEKKPKVVGASVVKGNVADVERRGLVYKAKIKQEDEDSIEFSLRSFFPSELKHEFALKLGRAIQSGTQPEIDPLINSYFEGLRKVYGNFRRASGTRVDTFYEINYYNQGEMSDFIKVLSDDLLKKEQCLVTCFDTLKTGKDSIECAEEENTYLRREEPNAGKITALVNKYVVCTLMSPRMKMELDHWIELNTIICHLTSSENAFRESLLDNFLTILKMESEKQPVPLPLFETIFKE